MFCMDKYMHIHSKKPKQHVCCYIIAIKKCHFLVSLWKNRCIFKLRIMIALNLDNENLSKQYLILINKNYCKKNQKILFLTLRLLLPLQHFQLTDVQYERFHLFNFKCYFFFLKLCNNKTKGDPHMEKLHH